MKVAVCSISSRKDCLLRTIQSLIIQTVPCEIHLLLSEEPFLFDKGFPNKEAWEELKQLPVTIHWVPNWGSYRKNVSFIKLFPEDVFLAIDDDEEFHPQFIETILKEYTGGVMAFRAAHISEKPYTQWESVAEPTTSVSCFHKGNGGVIYDSKLFKNPAIFDEKKFLELAPTNDDIWMNLWRIHQQIPVHVLPLYHIPIPQQTRLWFYNHDKNDVMIEKVKNHIHLL